MYVECICMYEYLNHHMETTRTQLQIWRLYRNHFLVNEELVNIPYFYVTCSVCHPHGHNSHRFWAHKPMKTKRARYCVAFLLKPLVFLAEIRDAGDLQRKSATVAFWNLLFSKLITEICSKIMLWRWHVEEFRPTNAMLHDVEEFQSHHMGDK